MKVSVYDSTLNLFCFGLHCTKNIPEAQKYHLIVNNNLSEYTINLYGFRFFWDTLYIVDSHAYYNYIYTYIYTVYMIYTVYSTQHGTHNLMTSHCITPSIRIQSITSCYLLLNLKRARLMVNIMGG